MRAFNTNDQKQNDALREYKEKGGFIIEGLIGANVLDDVNKYLDTQGSSYKQLYFDTPWGYGNMSEHLVAEHIKRSPWLENFSTRLLKSEWKFNHVVCNEKSPFVGYEVEWHQEVYNIDTFAPGCRPEDAEKYFYQIFVALDDQDAENGGLWVLSGSNKLGVLDSIDIISPALTHKRSVTIDALKMANSRSVLECPALKAGDALVFSPLLIHGSPRNISSQRRRSLVVQIASLNAPARDQNVYDAEIRHRHDFVVSTLDDKISKMKNENIYSELKAK
jgi:hypothetical protein